MQPFGHNRYGPKIGGLCPFGGGGAGSQSNTMWPGPRPTCMSSFILIYPTVWPQYTNVTDRQQSDSIGQAILQMVAQKLWIFPVLCVTAKVHALVITTLKGCPQNFIKNPSAPCCNIYETIYMFLPYLMMMWPCISCLMLVTLTFALLISEWHVELQLPPCCAPNLNYLPPSVVELQAQMNGQEC